MTALLRTPARRIAFAAMFSVLAHLLILWLPKISLPHDGILLPPLVAKLDPLPKLAAQQRPKPAPRPRPARHPKPVAKPASPEPDSLPVIDAASAVGAASAVEAASAVSAEPVATTQEKPKAAHPLPKHAQLTFLVYKGLDHFQIGTVNQELEIKGNEYTLKAVTRTVGLAKMFKNYQLTQISHGKADKQGLKPDTFEEKKINDGDKEDIKATFDWPAQKLHFSQGGDTELPAGAQDMLSIFYNLSQLPMNSDTIPLVVSNGKKLEKYEFEIEPEEEIITSMGKLKVLHLRKLHAKGESGFEIWLGLEYRLLPVKYMLIEPSGEVSGEIVISDIRVADE